MNRTVLLLVAAMTLVCVAGAPAVAELAYYDYAQPASWQGVSSSNHALVHGEPVVMADQPVTIEERAEADNEYLEAFVGDKPDQIAVIQGDVDKDGCDYGCDKGGKGGKGGYGWCPCWTFDADLLVLRREQTPGLDLSHRPGIRISAARAIDACRDIEFEFFGVDQWSHVTPTLAYGTDLYSTELNWRRAWGYGRVKTLIGVRLMELDENRATPGVIEDIDNHLIGLQVGVEGTLWECRRWEVEAGMKMGIYHNSADYDATGLAATLGADHTAFAGELWIGANYCLTNCIDLRVGYQGLWIEGVTDITTMSPASVALDMGGSPFYHGFYVGVEACF